MAGSQAAFAGECSARGGAHRWTLVIRAPGRLPAGSTAHLTVCGVGVGIWLVGLGGSGTLLGPEGTGVGACFLGQDRSPSYRP